MLKRTHKKIKVNKSSEVNLRLEIQSPAELKVPILFWWQWCKNERNKWKQMSSMSKSLEIQKKKLNLSADGWKDPRRFTSRSSTVTASVRTSASIKEHDPDTVWGLWLIFSLTLASRHGWLLLTDSLTTVAGSPLSRIKKKEKCF